MNKSNKIGTKTDLCGTPLAHDDGLDKMLVMRTFWVGLESKEVIHCEVLDEKPYWESFYINLGCEIESKALNGSK